MFATIAALLLLVPALLALLRTDYLALALVIALELTIGALARWALSAGLPPKDRGLLVGETGVLALDVPESLFLVPDGELEKGFDVPAGTQVLVTEARGRTRRVQVLEGPKAGATAWVASEFVKQKAGPQSQSA